MFKRFVTRLLLAFGILAVASPVLACGTWASPVRDCCPEGAPAPCKGEQPPAHVTCCASASVVVQTVAIEAQRPAFARPSGSDTPNPLILAAWIHSLDVATLATVPIDEIRPEPGRNDQQIYLQTRRLRL